MVSNTKLRGFSRRWQSTTGRLKKKVLWSNQSQNAGNWLSRFLGWISFEDRSFFWRKLWRARKNKKDCFSCCMNILWEFYFLRMESICALYDKIMSVSTWLTVSWVKHQPEGRCSTERAFIVQQMRREDETTSAKIRKKLEKRGILICRLWCEKHSVTISSKTVYCSYKSKAMRKIYYYNNSCFIVL